ncbi:DUF6980 family protein [Streptomyces halobius]|uniref:DUF6980 family protein n=1 Tax=Streptomyces halobius TaxID=2879846 RepID=UPI0038734956
MDWHCDTHTDPFACPDALVGFSAKFQEYGLIVHDGAPRASSPSSARGVVGACPNHR